MVQQESLVLNGTSKYRNSRISFVNPHPSSVWRRYLKRLWRFRSSFILVLTPVLLSIIPAIYPSKEARCGFVIMVMAMYWTTEVIPIAVTSLIPVFAFPFLGIMDSGWVSMMYMKGTSMMFLGAVIVAIAVEVCNLHQRIALKVILVVGQSPRRLMAGFMMTTAFLSMWLSNIATAIMMSPILDAILDELCRKVEKKMEPTSFEMGNYNRSSVRHSLEDPASEQSSFLQNGDTVNEPIVILRREKNPAQDNGDYVNDRTNPKKARSGKSDHDDRMLRHALFSTILYAANLGGTAVITGHVPNLVFKSLLQSFYNDPTGLNFLTWMMYNIPGAIICCAVGFVWLQVHFLGLFTNKKKVIESSPEKQAAVKDVVEKKYNELGPVKFQEVLVIIMFVILLFLWLFRAPDIIDGWAKYFYDTYNVKVGAGAPSIFIAFLLFCLPARLDFLTFNYDKEEDEEPEDQNLCLAWEVVQSKVPWDVLLLFGGSSAIAEGANVSGLSMWLGEKLYVFNGVNPAIIVLLVTFFAAMFTEIIANIAVVAIMVPVLNKLGQMINVNPLYMMLPTTICCSYAFMLPVATPVNAIIMSAGRMKNRDTMRLGFLMNVLCVLVQNVMINTLGQAIFDFHGPMPAWVNSSTTITTHN